MSELHGFLLVTTDPMIVSGGTEHAWYLVEARLKRGLWPIYVNTRNRRRLEAGKHLAFYVGGQGKHFGEIVATAVIRSVERWSLSKGAVDPEKYLTAFADQVLRLESVIYLDQPVRLKNRVSVTSFAPTNMFRWGVVLMGGCRALTRRDWNLLVAPPKRSSDPKSKSNASLG